MSIDETTSLTHCKQRGIGPQKLEYLHISETEQEDPLGDVQIRQDPRKNKDLRSANRCSYELCRYLSPKDSNGFTLAIVRQLFFSPT